MGLAGVAWAATATLARVAAGTITGSTASTLTFSPPVSWQLIVSNRDTAAAYVLLNDSATTPTVSATNYDFVLDPNEEILLSRPALEYFPVARGGIYMTETTPTVRGVGW